MLELELPGSFFVETDMISEESIIYLNGNKSIIDIYFLISNYIKGGMAYGNNGIFKFH